MLAGLLCQTATVVGDNLLVANCGSATVAMRYGGDYRFDHCTFADYWRLGTRTFGSLFITNALDYGGVRYVWPMQVQLKDCIVYGSRAEGEMYVDLDPNVATSLQVEHCLVRGGEWDEDPKFVDPQEGDYHLEEDSPAWGIGYTYPDGKRVGGR